MLPVLLSAGPAAAQLTDEQVTKAVDRGVAGLLKAQNDKGWWTEGGVWSRNHKYAGGAEVYAMLALAYADVPMSNPKMAKGFDALLEFKMGHTYVAAARIMVLSKLMPRLDRELKDRARAVMKDDVTFLLRTQLPNGAWSYPGYDYFTDAKPDIRADSWDFSNTQMAVLGLSEAIRAGIEIPREPIERVQKLYLDMQNDDGGWNYGVRGEDGPSYGSMTAAAVASLFITRDYLYPGLGCPCRSGASRGKAAAVDEAIDRGLAWLGKNFKPSYYDPTKKGEDWTLYWLYAAERTGLASGMKYFGSHDWYAEGGAYILKEQNTRTGVWGGMHTYLDCYAICFLVKGRAPIVMNKLQFKGPWNSHSRDLANLIRVLESHKEQPLQWQIVTLESPVAGWHDSPILYITAEGPLDFGADERKKLRTFTDEGGTILFEASCGNAAAKRSWEQTCREVWPEFELKIVDKDHPLWTADQRIVGRLPSMFGMSDGLRTFMFVSWQDISCAWNTLSVVRDETLFSLGGNLYAYATDRRPIRSRLVARRDRAADRYADAKPMLTKPAELTLTRLKHGGDWFVGGNYSLVARTAGDLSAAVTGLKLSAAEPAAVANLKTDRAAVAWLTGRQNVTLADTDVTVLRAYLAGGGFLLAEASMGDPRYDTAFRAVAGQLGLRLVAVGKDDPLFTGKFDGGAGYAVDAARFTFALRAQRIGQPLPELYRLTLDGKLVGLYSPFDLAFCQTGMDAFDCRGYEPEDARAILANALIAVALRP
jgi:hypothetical protein